MAERQERVSYEQGYADGTLGGVFIGIAISILLYVAWRMGEAMYLGRFP